MTKTEFDALKMVVPGAMPFAAGTNATVTPAGATTGDFSMPDGFGPNFDAAPTADGSNMVQRGQMNFIGKMASYAPFMGQAGRDFWGFDPDVCVALGGYPKDAILTLVSGWSYLKIISLQDNNKVDFTGQTDIEKYPGIVNGTVDGVNWQYLSLDPQTLIDQSIIAEIPKTTFTQHLEQPITIFKASNEAALAVIGGLECEIDKPVETESSVTHYVYDVRLVVSPPYDTLKEMEDWSITGEDNKTIYRTGGERDMETEAINVEQVILEKGKFYGLGLVGKAWAPTGSTKDSWSLRVTIKESTLKVKMLVF